MYNASPEATANLDADLATLQQLPCQLANGHKKWSGTAAKAATVVCSNNNTTK
jgi:hypothetical protein